MSSTLLEGMFSLSNLIILWSDVEMSLVTLHLPNLVANLVASDALSDGRNKLAIITLFSVSWDQYSITAAVASMNLPCVTGVTWSSLDTIIQGPSIWRRTTLKHPISRLLTLIL